MCEKSLRDQRGPNSLPAFTALQYSPVPVHSPKPRGEHSHHSSSRDTITEEPMLAKGANHCLFFFWHGLPYLTSGIQHRCLRLEAVKTPWVSSAVNGGCRIQSQGLATLLL